MPQATASDAESAEERMKRGFTNGVQMLYVNFIFLVFINRNLDELDFLIVFF